MLEVKKLLTTLAVFSVYLLTTRCTDAQDKPVEERIKKASLSTFAASLVTDRALMEATKQIDQQTHPPVSEIEKFAAHEFMRFGHTLGLSQRELEDLRVANHGTFVLAMNNKWVYSVDSAGNQTFRSISNLPQLAKAFDAPYIANLGAAKTQFAKEKVAELAKRLGYDKEPFTNVVVKREVVLGCNCKSGRILPGNGRVLVRLCWDHRGDNCFQVIFSPEGSPTEFDTVGGSCKTAKGAAILKAALLGNAACSSLQDGIGQAKIGLFYGGNDYRFPSNALSWAGTNFTDPHSKNNPFQRTIFDDRFTGEFSTVDWEANTRSSQDFKFWDYIWWDMYGRTNGAAGNWNSIQQRWDKDVSMLFAPLSSYSFSHAGSTGSIQRTLKDGTRQFPQILSGILDDRFYEDLETCRMVVISTHGGPINQRFQLRRDIDEWFLVGNANHPFGTGSLRHMFFASCGSMGIFKQMAETPGITGNRVLLTEWMPGRYVRGVRTICGVDGEGTGLDRDGWRFFGHYNKGDAISSAYVNGCLDECVRNEPVTVAYGATLAEALTTLADGRFAADRAGSEWSAASVWQSVSGEF